MTWMSEGRSCFACVFLAGVLARSPTAEARSVGTWGPWEGRVMLGGEIAPRSFGILDVGLKKGPLSIQILTDTLDVRLAPELKTGRYWVGARVQTFAAGLMIAPWTAGAPDDTRAWQAGYVGADAGWLRYLPRGVYAGLAGSARLYFFWADERVPVRPPGLTPLFTLDGVLGHHTPSSHLAVRAGADSTFSRLAPHVYVEGVVRPAWAVAPRIEVRAGVAMGQDDIMRTRLGGLNPYVVPLAGAAWAEFWVENYIALRAGPSLRLPLPGRVSHTLELAVISDVAGVAGRLTAGFAVLARWQLGRIFLDGAFGWAPWIERQADIGRVSGLLLLGAHWGPFWKL